jgi:tetratricopeptide (TPR) repeat protein
MGQGNYVKAQEILERALNHEDHNLDPIKRASTLSNLGVALYQQGKNHQAIEQYEKAFAIQIEIFGGSDIRIVITL